MGTHPKNIEHVDHRDVRGLAAICNENKIHNLEPEAYASDKIIGTSEQA
jgi:hypothetical protein